MEYAIPIIILSANFSPYSERRQGCRETWVPLLRNEFHPVFAVGSPDLKAEWRFEGDILRVRCEDGYAHLANKMRLALKAVLNRFAFPWLFKCDDDTWLNPWRFNGYPFWNWDQVGAFAWGQEGWASGAGYSLSYRAARYVLSHWQEGQDTAAEDRYIGGLVRRMPGANRLNEPSILCDCGQDWKPCLLGHWIKTPEAMSAFHMKGREHEQATGITLSGYDLPGFATPPVEAPHVRTKPKSPATTLPTNAQIFVQIAAYRDRDLLPTLRDLVAKAKDPNRLRIGLCWQRAAEDSLEEFSSDPRMRVRDVPWQQAKGICWARHCTQELYENEEFTLQIDAHERFVEGWDEKIVGMLAETDAAKPILTTYPAHFTPDEKMPSDGVPHQIQTQHFRENGTVNQFPCPISNFEELTHPVPARFLAGGFLFTYGAHCREVPYDPMIYFSDEISMAVRSYTHGYDLFHPHRHLAWHYYVRQGALRHWDDHSETARKDGITEHFWWLREWRSQLQHEQLFGMADHCIKELRGFGPERTLADYERFSGIDFVHRKIHKATLAGDPPPVPHEDEWDWKFALRRVVAK